LLEYEQVMRDHEALILEYEKKIEQLSAYDEQSKVD
jgi:hypothetical protein